jgi:G3E family GTPase
MAGKGKGGMSADWNAHLQKAKSCCEEASLFEGVQAINAAIEAYVVGMGHDGHQMLRKPLPWLQSTTLDESQRATFLEMFLLRGDILIELGAAKRAYIELDCAAYLAPENPLVAQKKQALADLEAGKDTKVPVTVLTGFLGSGKTTLLNRILKENHGKRIAVLENEFGEVGIDDALVSGNQEKVAEEIVVMNNGCICCTVRGDLIRGLKTVMKASADRPLDGVLIETTGLADPAPVAQTFFADDFVQRKMRLDGILTVVDAKHVVQHLDEEKPDGAVNEAIQQIAFADRVLLNKVDLVDSETTDAVEERIKELNSTVKVKRTVQSEVEMDFLLGIRAFSLDKVLDMDDGFLDDYDDNMKAAKFNMSGASVDKSRKKKHTHDNRVSSYGINVAKEVDMAKLQTWIRQILEEKGNDMYRMKGVLAVQGKDEKFVFQAIHMQFISTVMGTWGAGEQRRCKLCFIGKNLDKASLKSNFEACLV